MAQSKNNKTHYDHLINLKTKLEYVDKHIRRSENLPPSFFMQPQLLMHISKQKNYSEPSLEMMLNEPKTFLIHEQPVVKFYFQYSEISSEKKFCLRVCPSKTEVELQMQTQGGRKKYYIMSSSKALIIDEENWKLVNFVLRAKKSDKLSVVKIEVDTIIIDHKVKIHGVPSQRKIVEKELKQYLKNNMNKDKINEILEKRRRKSFTRATSMGGRVSSADKTSNSFYNVQSYASVRIFRNSTGFSQSTSLRKKEKVIQQPRLRTAIEKKRLNQFQKSKKLYLNHLQKMSPEKYNRILEQQKQYHIQKKEAAKNISKITMALVFMYKTLRVCVDTSKNNIRKIKIRMLCKKFIKNLIHANKMRLTFKNRYKTSFSLNLALLTNFFYEKSTQKSINHIVNSIQKQCFKKDVMTIGNLCQKYGSAVKVLQRNFKLNRALFLHRFEQLAVKIKGYKFESKDQLLSVYKKYKQYCYSKSKRLKYGFTKYHKQIDQIMKQNIKQKLKL